MKQERVQILKMLESGKINAEEAARLLQAVETVDDKAGAVSAPAEWLRIRVVDGGGGEKVNVNLPISLLSVAARFIPEKYADQHGVDIQEIMAAIKDGVRGKLVEVHDEKEGTHVEIVVE